MVACGLSFFDVFVADLFSSRTLRTFCLLVSNPFWGREPMLRVESLLFSALGRADASRRVLSGLLCLLPLFVWLFVWFWLFLVGGVFEGWGLFRPFPLSWLLFVVVLLVAPVASSCEGAPLEPAWFARVHADSARAVFPALGACAPLRCPAWSECLDSSP